MGQRSVRYLGMVVLFALGLAACGGDETADAGAAPSRVRAGDKVAQDGAPSEEAPNPPPPTGSPATTPPRPAPAHIHPVTSPELRLEATGEPYEEGEVGPRVEAGEQEVTAFATGLWPSAAVNWCAGAVDTECFVGADQRTDPQGRSVFRFIVPSGVDPGPARVTVWDTPTGAILAIADFHVVPSTAGCPDEGIGCPLVASGSDPCAGQADCCPPPPEISDNPSCPFPGGDGS